MLAALKEKGFNLDEPPLAATQPATSQEARP